MERQTYLNHKNLTHIHDWHSLLPILTDDSHCHEIYFRDFAFDELF